jgi:hypothetical protein
MLKVLVWATTFGADLWSLTKYLDGRDDVEVRVLLRGAEAYASQPVAKLLPLQCKMAERRPWHHLVGWPGFRPDVTVMDNWVPKRRTSPKGFVLWHGFGWKGPNDREEFAPLHRNLARCWGDPTVPNPDFRWQCFGPSDFEHRTKVSGFAPDNCRILGAASHDDLRHPLDRTRVADAYPLDILGRRNVLIAPTWHYGEVFAHWGRDAELFERLVDHIGRLGANAIVRLHDSFRFPPAYREFLTELDRKHDHVLLKFKDHAPDNYIDLQVADVLITNFSSIANLFYATRRPTIHVYPVASADETFMWRTFDKGRVVERKLDSVRYVWKFPPEQNGGLLAHDFEQLLAQTEQALADPDCCREVCEAFLADHMLGADGGNCRRIFDALTELALAKRP